MLTTNWLTGQMISLSLRMGPHVKGYVHVQTNPSYSYSTPKTIQNAQRKQHHLHMYDTHS